MDPLAEFMDRKSSLLRAFFSALLLQTAACGNTGPTGITNSVELADYLVTQTATNHVCNVLETIFSNKAHGSDVEIENYKPFTLNFGDKVRLEIAISKVMNGHREIKGTITDVHGEKAPGIFNGKLYTTCQVDAEAPPQMMMDKTLALAKILIKTFSTDPNLSCGDLLSNIVIESENLGLNRNPSFQGTAYDAITQSITQIGEKDGHPFVYTKIKRADEELYAENTWDGTLQGDDCQR